MNECLYLENTTSETQVMETGKKFEASIFLWNFDILLLHFLSYHRMNKKSEAISMGILINDSKKFV